jgi:hypothetical protein
VTSHASAAEGRWGGRTLREWVPDVVAETVRRVDPERVILFGSPRLNRLTASA